MFYIKYLTMVILFLITLFFTHIFINSNNLLTSTTFFLISIGLDTESKLDDDDCEDDGDGAADAASSSM